LKIWGETKGDFFLIILECVRHVELCETVWVFCNNNKTTTTTTTTKEDTNLRKSVLPSDGSAVAHL
jgi:hypothetical protein